MVCEIVFEIVFMKTFSWKLLKCLWDIFEVGVTSFDMLFKPCYGPKFLLEIIYYFYGKHIHHMLSLLHVCSEILRNIFHGGFLLQKFLNYLPFLLTKLVLGVVVMCFAVRRWVLLLILNAASVTRALVWQDSCFNCPS